MTEYEKTSCLIYAFRYALGRSSYATAEVAQMIKKYKKLLREDEKLQIIDDIITADKKNDIGMKVDKDIWNQLKENLRKDLGQ